MRNVSLSKGRNAKANTPFRPGLKPIRKLSRSLKTTKLHKTHTINGPSAPSFSGLEAQIIECVVGMKCNSLCYRGFFFSFCTVKWSLMAGPRVTPRHLWISSKDSNVKARPSISCDVEKEKYFCSSIYSLKFLSTCNFYSRTCRHLQREEEEEREGGVGEFTLGTNKIYLTPPPQLTGGYVTPSELGSELLK